MPRKLCWIEVDEEGKAVGPIDYSGIGISVQRAVVNALPDATEEVVEAVADALVMAALTNTEIEPYNATAEARDILRRLAAASPSKEKADGA